MKKIGTGLIALFSGVFGASLVHLCLRESAPFTILISAILLGGVGGGFTLGLIGGERYGLKLPGKVGNDAKVDPGFLGDVFVGIMSAFLGIGLASRTLKTDLFSIPMTIADKQGLSFPVEGALAELWFLNFCIAYVSGFLGLRLVKGLSERFLQETKLKDKLEQVDHNEGATAYLSGQSSLALQLFDEAEDYFKKAFRLDKGNEVRSLLGLARVYKRQRRYAEALSTADEAISRRSSRDSIERMAAAYWNRACYRALVIKDATTLQRGTTENVYQDLEESLRLKPEFRNDLSKEEDLTIISGEDRFKELIAGSTQQIGTVQG